MLDDYTIQDGVPQGGDESQRGQMPASIESERAIFGAILLDPNLFDQAAEILTPDMFMLDGHRRIFRRMTELVEDEQPIDMTMLAVVLDTHKEIDAVGGIAYLSSLIDGVPERPSIRAYCETVKSRFLMRQIINVAQLAISTAIESPEATEEVLSRLEQGLLEITDATVRDKGFVTLADSVRDAGGLDGYLHKVTDPVAMSGIPTGYELYDHMTGGLKPSEMVIIAARPGMGKTAFAMNVAENIVLHDPEMVIACFSIEMSARAILSRSLASAARVNLRRIQRGDYVSRSENEKLMQALERLVDKQIFIDDASAITPIKMRAKLRNLKRKKGRLDLVMIDYLQLMSSGFKLENRQQEVSATSRGVKALCKDMDIPFLVLAQLNRGVEGRKDTRPILSDLRESGQLEQDADTVGFIHRPEMYDPDPDIKGIAELIIGKQREGPVDIIKLAFLSEWTRFENLAIP